VRYEVQGAWLRDTLGRSEFPPTWTKSGYAFTEKGARRVWWRCVNRPVADPLLAVYYRIYDKKLGKVVEM
jgi:hypothetical protein